MTLDEAWAEAEAALPEGWTLERLGLMELSRQWEASAFDYGKMEYHNGYGLTPAAALHALAIELRAAADRMGRA